MDNDLKLRINQKIIKRISSTFPLTWAELYDEIEAIIDQQKQELLDALTIEKRKVTQNMYYKDHGWNEASDELEAKKQKIREEM